MAKLYVMGIDIGISSCKVGLFDQTGNCIEIEKGRYEPKRAGGIRRRGYAF